jgi:hypothetical protein
VGKFTFEVGKLHLVDHGVDNLNVVEKLWQFLEMRFFE